MNKTVKFIIAMLVLVAIVFGLKSYATEVLDNTVVNYDDQVMPISVEDEGNYIPAEWRRDVNTSNIMDGNLFEAGDEYILEDKDVLGDAYIAGDNVTLKDVTISGNLFLFGSNVSFENVYVTGSAYVFGLEFDSNEYEVAGTLYLASEEADIKSVESSFKDVYAYAEKLELSAIVNRDMIIAGEVLNVDEGTTIGRNFTYPSDVDVEIDESVKAQGETTTFEMNSSENVVVEEPPVLETIKSSITSTLTFSSVILIFVVLCSDKIIAVSRKGNGYGNILPAAGKGLLVIIGGFIAFVLLAITIIGIPLALIGLLLLIVLFVIALPVAAVSLTSMFLKGDINKMKLFLVSLVVLLVISVVESLPLGLLGVIISFVIFSFGIGMAVNAITKKVDVKTEKNAYPMVMTVEKKEVKAAKVVEEEEETTAENIDVLNKLDEIDDDNNK